uniref:Ubiquitin carboxyl-terminal hydrolase n=1 Tax=Rhabditophanes sp. KR3021 TaxID=114890 RepID=A0AC35TT10_9BILA
MPTVNVKWGPEKYSIDVDQQQPPIVLKTKLFELTGVVQERQKVLIKGKVLDDNDWKGLTLSEGAMLMMMGSVVSIPVVTSPEDTAMQVDVTADGIILPAGFKNLGNTCYLNATLQALRSVPELCTAVSSYVPNPNDSSHGNHFTLGTQTLFRQMENDKKTNGVTVPVNLLNLFHKFCPQMATLTPQGGLEQQDANEAFCEISKFLFSKLTIPGTGTTKFSKLFEGRMIWTMKNVESESEAPSVGSEEFLQLSCYLNADVKYLQSGLKAKMKEHLEKMSEEMGRNCQYEKNTVIDRLPAYLSVQLVRFFYKEKGKVNAKILKDVKFSMHLDVIEMCSSELQEKLKPARIAFKEEDDAMVHRKKEDLEGLTYKKHPFSFQDDAGSNNSGMYELQAVITHKGRYANAGHYVGWVKIEGGKWVMCDDEHVEPVTEEQVLKLSGGGDWHCAYVLVYGPRILSTPI